MTRPSFARTQRDTVRAESYGPYYDFLHLPYWPSESTGQNEAVEDMAPQHAASCLAKLVRWARLAPLGDVAVIDDADAREEYVRKSRLGMILAARACNLPEEHFHALYGEYGSYTDVDPHEVMALLAVALGDKGVDWSIQQRIKLAAGLTEEMLEAYRIGKRP